MYLNTDLYGRIQYREMKGSPRESYVGRQGKVQRRFIVPWNKRWQFTQYFLGFSYVPTNVAYKYIKRVPPQGYSAVVQNNDAGNFDEYWLYATDLDLIEGLDPKPEDFPMEDGDDTPYRNAAVSISYESLTFKVRNDDQMKQSSFTHDSTTTGYPEDFAGGRPRRYITKVTQPTAEYLKMSFGSFNIIVDNKVLPVSLGQGKVVPAAEIIYIWHQFPAYLKTSGVETSRVYYPDVVKSYLGTVNLTEFDGYAAGTLLLTAFEYKPYRNVGGFICGDLTFKMKHFEPVNKDASGNTLASGHNYQIFPDFKAKPWERRNLQYFKAAARVGGTEQQPTYLEDSSDGAYLYDSREFKDLFKATQP